MPKRFALTIILAAFTLPSFSTINKLEGFYGIQPELVQQIQAAQDDLKTGQSGMAMARTDLVLLDHPLRIYAQFDNVGAHQEDCEKAILGAISLWNTSLGETQFIRVADPTQADIKLTYKMDVDDSGSAVGGLVSWRRSIAFVKGEPEDSTTAAVQVRVRNPRGGFMSFELMRHETSHELGHVLGLEDSPRRGQIMSQLDLHHPVTKVSEFEVDAIQHLRQAAQSVRDEAVLTSVAL